MLDCKPASLGKVKKVPLLIRNHFKRLIGRLIYLNHTGLDISFAVSCLSQFMSESHENHLQEARQVLSYQKNTIGQGLLFARNENLSVEVYIDIDYVN